VRAEIVAVGTELLLGQIANTNARWMSESLAAIGADVLHHQAVGDNQERIVEALRLASSRADVVIVTGGLGPTQDDITRDAFGNLLGVRMVRHPELEEMLRDKFRSFGRREMPESNLRQADVPEGATYIRPRRGTAPGLAAELHGGVRVFAVPGVPEEMVEMMEGAILPELASAAGSGVVRSRVLRCAGIGESALAERVDDLFLGSANPTIAFLASSGEVKVRITAKATTVKEADALIEPVAEEVRRRLGDEVFTSEDESLEEAVVRLLRDAGKRLACAESITGGGVGARVTSVPGASEVFVGSAVVYMNEAKMGVLGLPREILDGPGPVSEECARQMAAGARRVFGADLGLALTGAAGPESHGGVPPPPRV
jgi:nicotinamide-nucleotide amidase